LQNFILVVREFLLAIREFDIQWSKAQSAIYYTKVSSDMPLDFFDLYTSWFADRVRFNKDHRTDRRNSLLGIFATQGDTGRSGHVCPCSLYQDRHTFPPSACNAVRKALYRTPAKPGFQVSEQRVAKVKEQIYNPGYKALKEQIAKIRGNPPANTTSTERMPEMVATPPNPNRQRTSGVNAIIRLGAAIFVPEEIAISNENKLTDHTIYSVFQPTKVSYAASLLYNNHAIIHVPNILKKIINFKNTTNENVIFVNDIRSIMTKISTKIYP
jgi:hypothetical protein